MFNFKITAQRFGLVAVFIATSWLCSAEEVRTLFLGGSHSLGEFGHSLDRQVRSAGVDLTTVVDGGAGPYHWLKVYQAFPSSKGHWFKDSAVEKRMGSQRKVAKLEVLMEDVDPSYVVIQAEWNLFATLRSPRRDKVDNVAELRFLVSQMCREIRESGARAYWILPPYYDESRYSKELQGELKKIMIEVISEFEFHYFDSSQVVKNKGEYPLTDGISFSADQYESWSIAVSKDFLEILPQTPNKQLTVPLLISQPIPVSTPRLDPLGKDVVNELKVEN